MLNNLRTHFFVLVFFFNSHYNIRIVNILANYGNYKGFPDFFISISAPSNKLINYIFVIYLLTRTL